MGDETRVIWCAARKAAASRKFLELYTERGYFVLRNRRTGVRRYYASLIDVLRILSDILPAWRRPGESPA